WVEHDPEELWTSVLEAIDGALRDSAVPPESLCAIGITNQRETTLLWEKESRRPAHRAIVWQDRRTSALCSELTEAGHAPRVQEVTGLVIDPYFSGSKLTWLLSNHPELERDARAGRLAFGTVDSYLVERLTGGSL